MPAENSELRRILDRIGRLPADDAEAILSGLTPRQRDLALKLLNGQGKRSEAASALSRTLSPWLLERLARPDVLAPLARVALRDCAEDLGFGHVNEAQEAQQKSLFESLRSRSVIGKALPWRD